MTIWLWGIHSSHNLFACTCGNGCERGARALWIVVTVSDRSAFDLPPFRRCVEDFSWSPFLPTVFEVSNYLRASSVPRNKVLKCAAFFGHSNRMTAYLCRSVSFAFSTNYFFISLLKYKVWSRHTIVISDDEKAQFSLVCWLTEWPLK